MTDTRGRDGMPLIDSIREDQLWGNIRRLAKKDPYIQELLDKLVVYYKLKYERK
jgi:hypothetical protein